MKLRRNLVLIAAGLLLVGSFFLPNAVAGVTDARRLGSITTIDSQSFIFDAVPALSMPDRLALIANQNTEMLPWRSGNAMDEVDAIRRVAQEFARFLRGGPIEFDFQEFSVEESSAVFVIDAESPTVNMIVWELTLIDSRENMAVVTLDDETGLIIKIIYRQGRRGQSEGWGAAAPSLGRTDDELHAVATRLTEMMTEYYGRDITLADYHFSGSTSYYRADVITGGRAIPMFGVVRSTSFTMNERVQG